MSSEGLVRQLNAVAADSLTWPDWKKREVGMTYIHYGIPDTGGICDNPSCWCHGQCIPTEESEKPNVVVRYELIQPDPYEGWVIERVEDDGTMRIRSKTGAVKRIKVIGTTEMEDEIKRLKSELDHANKLLDVICKDASWSGYRSDAVAVNVYLWTIPRCDGRQGTLRECAEKVARGT
jgi:hypothetical protein